MHECVSVMQTGKMTMSQFYYTKPSQSPLHASYMSAQFKVIIKKHNFKSHNSLFVTFIDNKL